MGETRTVELFVCFFLRLCFFVNFLFVFLLVRLWFLSAFIYTSRDFEVPVRCVLSILLLILIPTQAAKARSRVREYNSEHTTTSPWETPLKSLKTILRNGPVTFRRTKFSRTRACCQGPPLTHQGGPAHQHIYIYILFIYVYNMRIYI